MRTLSIAALVLAATLALSACSDDGPDPGDSMSTWTPSGTPEQPSPSATPSPDPTEPPLPDAATKATEAGARAFITYYWDLINYAQVTGDVKALRRVSGPNCEGCNAGIAAIQEHYRNGGRIEGGEYEVAVVKVNELKTDSRTPLAYEAKLDASNSEQTVTQSDGTVDREPEGTSVAVVAAIWLSSAWRLEAMEIR